MDRERTGRKLNALHNGDVLIARLSAHINVSQWGIIEFSRKRASQPAIRRSCANSSYEREIHIIFSRFLE